MVNRTDLINYLARMTLPNREEEVRSEKELVEREVIPGEEQTKLTENQIEALMALVLNDGSYLLDPMRDSDLTYQIVGQIHEFGFDAVWRAIISRPLDETLPPGSDTIATGRASSMEVWLESEGLSDARLQNLVILDIRMSRLEIGEALYTCPKCSKQETIFYQKQTRSADEPMTITVKCILCDHEWTED